MRKLVFMILLCCSVVVSCNADVPFSYDACELICTNKFNTSTNGDEYNKCVGNCVTSERDYNENLLAESKSGVEANQNYWDNVIEIIEAGCGFFTIVSVVIGVSRFLI